jgi:hypothetical protein
MYVYTLLYMYAVLTTVYTCCYYYYICMLLLRLYIYAATTTVYVCFSHDYIYVLRLLTLYTHTTHTRILIGACALQAKWGAVRIRARPASKEQGPHYSSSLRPHTLVAEGLIH